MKSVSPSVQHLRRNARRLTLWFGLLLLAGSVPFITHGQRQADDEQAAMVAVRTAQAGHKRAEFVPGSVLVRFRTDAAAKTAERNVAALQLADGAQVETQVERFAGSDLVKGLRLAHVAPDETLQAVAALNSRPDVLYAEPDYLRHIERLPDEAEFTNLWSLKNVGQFIRVNYRSPGLCDTPPCNFAAGTAGADIKAEQAWDITTGNRNIVVGVIDEGVDISHPDLAANIWTNPGEIPGNGIDDDGNGFVDDVHGWDFANNDNTVFDGDVNPALYPDDKTDAHGTHVSGTIGAVGNNGVGSVGISWQVSLLPLKFLNPSGGSSSNSIRAVAYAKALRDKYVATGGAQGANVRVLNNSYGGGGFAQSEQDAIAALAGSQILFVAAAGNDSSNNDAAPSYPANYNAPNLISVAATTRTDSLASYSNYGMRTVQIAAPGSLVLSTTPNNTYDFYSGTSMATPHVAGVAALALAANPNLSVTKLRAILLYNGDANASAAGKVYSRRRLNAYQTLLAAAENDTTAPAAVSGLRVTAQSGRTVSLAWTAPGDDGNTGQAALYELNFVDPGTNRRIFLGTQLPQSAGTSESANFTLPYRHVTGLISIKAIDNVGNESAVVSLAVALDPAAVDPYVPAESGASALSVGGTDVGLHDDDGYQTYNFPAGFSFPFYGQNYTSATLSTNGVLYFTPRAQLPTRDDGSANDVPSLVAALDNLTAIAGMWDDLRTDNAGGGIFVSQPAGDRLVFRWEGKTFNTTNAESGFPYKFEIELRSDGTSQIRYGSGTTGLNTTLNPVVGISGGGPEAYIVASHTRDLTQGPPINLTNAGTVTFGLRNASTPTAQFSAATASVGEGAGQATLTITRAGDVSKSATVGYATIDDPAEVRCDTVNGTAYARCDYATTVDTLTFAAGEAAKNITIPIIDDGHFEGAETFRVALTNSSVGLALNTPAIMTVTIQDNDTATTANPIFTTPFFVRQHYLDFLSREPEPNEPFTAILNGCANVNNTDPNSPSASCDRLNISGQFFGSPEFQLKGVYVIVFYRVAFNRLPEYVEFAQDLRSVTGTTAQETFAKRATFATSFVQRPEFVNAYGTLSNSAYVTTLMGRYQLSSITTPDPANPDGTTKVTLTTGDLLNRLNAGTLTRAQILRAIVQSDEVSLQREATNAFVAAQYYGYLRRTPDTGGFNGWVNYLATHPGDFRTMVNGFVNSIEYRLRFGAQ